MSPDSVGLKLYPSLLSLQYQYPKLVIDYRFAPNVDVEKALVAGEVDIGLMTRLSTLEAVDCRSIVEEALLLVTPKSVSEPSWQNLNALGFHSAASACCTGVHKTAPYLPASSF